MKTNHIIAGLGIMAAILTTSCKKEPTACFTTNQTTVSAGTPIQCNASCSQEAEKYFWIANTGADVSGDGTGSTETYTFSTAGTYEITLMVSNGKKESEVTKTVTVTP